MSAAAPSADPAAPVLRARDLVVDFPMADGRRHAAVDGVSLTVRRGEIVGVVGESGSGKSMTALAALGLVPAPGRVSGSLEIAGREVVGASEADLRRLRGAVAGMVFQDPMTALNPVRSIGAQIVEAVRRHRRVSRGEALERAAAALASVGIPAPAERLKAYPHELSGGLRQRVVIAMALVNDPAVILADEPTTALDATIQAQILDLFRARPAAAGTLLITHDLGVAAEVCDRILVMYHGRIVEEGPALRVLRRPLHRYTEALLRAAPRFDPARPPLRAIPGLPPALGEQESGCAFRPRCAAASERCAGRPPTISPEEGHAAACWHPAAEPKEGAA